jgi:hypothetical protein
MLKGYPARVSAGLAEQVAGGDSVVQRNQTAAHRPVGAGGTIQTRLASDPVTDAPFW